MDEEVQYMVELATQVVDPIAEDSWARDCVPLMPTYRERVHREQEEEARRVE